MVKSPCCAGSGLRKGPWSPEEDEKLISYINTHGRHGSWKALPKLAGLSRCGKGCRLRWTNYLRPDIKKDKFTPEEERIILNLHAILGNKWSVIATHLPGRTDNAIKNFWNTHVKKKLVRMGFDPITHRPRTDLFSAIAALQASLHQQSQPWQDHHQALRLRTELAKLHYVQSLLHPANAPSSSLPNCTNDIPTNTTASITDTLNFLASLPNFTNAISATTDTLNHVPSLPTFKGQNPTSDSPHYLRPNAPSSLPNYTNAITTTTTPPVSDMSTPNNFISFTSLKDPIPAPDGNLQGLHESFVNFSQFPGLHSSSAGAGFSHGGQYSPASPWLASSSSPPTTPADARIRSDDWTTASNQAGDASSSNGNQSYIWPDFLLDDSLFQDLP